MRLHRLVFVAAVTAVLGGCSSGPAPQSAGQEPSQLPPVDPSTGYSRIISGAADSAGWESGGEDAAYRYRFRMTSPASDRFTFRDRDLSFYFRPSTDALHFQVENLQDRPVWIDWERSSFRDPNGGSDRLAHASTRWSDRFGTQAPTQIPGLQRYGDYAFPMQYLVDPAGKDEQLHRRLFPEDEASFQYVDREFGVDLVFLVEDRPRTYTFRFRVASVVPR